MSPTGEHAAALLRPLTLSERVAVGEDFFQRFYRAALIITVLLAASAGVLAIVSDHSAPTGTIVVALLIGAGAIGARRASSYDWLRRHRYALTIAGPLTAISSLWPTVDANAVYYPALAPLALSACVAQRRAERVAVIVSLAIGTAVAATLDARSPQLSSPEKLAGATIAVAVLGVLIAVVVDWCARRVLLEPDDRGDERPALPDALVAAADDDRVDRDEQGRLNRVAVIAKASREQLTRLRPATLADLTARELQILFLVVEGLDRHDIGDCLSISPKTVDKHVERVRTKTGLTHTGRPTSWLTAQLGPIGLQDLQRNASIEQPGATTDDR